MNFSANDPAHGQSLRPHILRPLASLTLLLGLAISPLWAYCAGVQEQYEAQNNRAISALNKAVEIINASSKIVRCPGFGTFALTPDSIVLLDIMHDSIKGKTYTASIALGNSRIEKINGIDTTLYYAQYDPTRTLIVSGDKAQFAPNGMSAVIVPSNNFEVQIQSLVGFVKNSYGAISRVQCQDLKPLLLRAKPVVSLYP